MKLSILVLFVALVLSIILSSGLHHEVESKFKREQVRADSLQNLLNTTRDALLLCRNKDKKELSLLHTKTKLLFLTFPLIVKPEKVKTLD